MSGVPSVLRRIVDERRADAQSRAREVPLESLQEIALSQSGPSGRFVHALRVPGLSVIAEIKRASPSRGSIAAIEDVGALGRAYAEGGARAISVLTEPRHFGGSAKDLEALALQGDVPLLRKDFLTSPYEMWEARAWGASAALVIAAVHDTIPGLRAMLDAAAAAQIDALVEVHTERELDLALQAGATIIGVNNRNLHTFQVDLAHFDRLRARMPDHVVAVAESGIHGRADAARMASAGADAVLVGESLARADNPAALVRELAGAGQPASEASPTAILKVCGIARPLDAVAAYRAGATHLGVVFAPRSRRCVSVEEARAVVASVRGLLPVYGVFQAQPMSDVLAIARAVGLDGVQLHGGFDDDAISSARVAGFDVAWAVAIDEDGGYELPSATPEMLLLDTKSGAGFGGTGTVFPWSRVRRPSTPFVVAGGVSAENMVQAFRALLPAGFDVSGSVETAPRVKSAASLASLGRAFWEIYPYPSAADSARVGHGARRRGTDQTRRDSNGS